MSYELGVRSYEFFNSECKTNNINSSSLKQIYRFLKFCTLKIMIVGLKVDMKFTKITIQKNS